AKKSHPRWPARKGGPGVTAPGTAAANCDGSTAWAPRIVERDAASELLARLDTLARSETVAVIAAPAAAAPRADELAAVIGRHLVMVLAGDERDAAARARELAEHGAGLAIAPFDGIESSALVESACAACDRASAGAVVRAEDAIEHIAIGSRVAVVADAAT